MCIEFENMFNVEIYMVYMKHIILNLKMNNICLYLIITLCKIVSLVLYWERLEQTHPDEIMKS